MSVEVERKTKLPKKHVNWLKLIDRLNQETFNEELDSVLADCVRLRHDDFDKHKVKDSAKVVREVKIDYKRWFKESRDMLISSLKERKKIIALTKVCRWCDEGLKKNIKNAIKDAMSFAKVRW